MAHAHRRSIESPGHAQERLARYPSSFDGLIGHCRWKRCPQRIVYLPFSPEGAAGWAYMKLQIEGVGDDDNELKGPMRAGPLTW
jgi:hypothetical protein